MKITDYEKVRSLVANNVLLVDGDAGTKGILAKDLALALLALMSPKEQVSKMVMADLEQTAAVAGTDRIIVGQGSSAKAMTINDALFAMLDAVAPMEVRRTTFRGKNLGAAYTSEQKARIADGTWKGFFLGDYWEIGGRVYRITDFNYWANCGDNAVPPNHLVIMPDGTFYNHVMNDMNTTEGGYYNSKMRKSGLDNAKTIINAAFGEANILNHRALFTNAVTNGKPSGGSWYDSTVELPNEIMMYGCPIFTPGCDGTTIPYLYTVDKSQLALMQVNPKFINPMRQNQWLRDVVSGAFFAYVYGIGFASTYGASHSGFGVRPVFGIKG